MRCDSAGKPKTVEPPTPELGEGVQVVAAAQGASCATACELAGARCVEDQLPALNNCNILRDYFACEGGELAALPVPTTATSQGGDTLRAEVGISRDILWR